MIYLVNRYKNFFVLDNDNGLDEINSSNNEDAIALMEGFMFKSKLYNLAKTKFECSVEDLGVTILLINFSKFYSRNQYILFSNFFKHINEIKHLELYLTNSVRKLKYYDLGIDSKYGILAQRDRFTSKRIMNYFEYLVFLTSFHNEYFYDKERTIEYFSQYDIKLVEAFYNLTSLPNIKTIKESNVIVRPVLMYKFKEIIKTSKFDADYWFVLPSKVIWFAYFKGQFYFTGYVEYSLDEQFKRFYNFDNIIVGYISKNRIFPLYFECRPFWHQSMEMFKRHNIVSHIVSKDIVCRTYKNLYFVKEGDFNVYKFVK